MLNLASDFLQNNFKGAIYQKNFFPFFLKEHEDMINLFREHLSPYF